ncbi:hypothetical protein R0135_13430 [Congregibacter variabilis]|uniref:Uncharacterized protein n=1 Tax=Congregibacter variabilis TaxID=3081200 RepID=A0ABZ0I159_9GAMM|nr:hypothetical protein R0135_13430 [Congregibacter sp. IMCC43200]
MKRLPTLPGLVIALAVITLSACTERVQLPDGVFAPDAPKQWKLEGPPRRVGEFRLSPQAGYEITAKVLSKRHYRWDDLAALAPWDFALGWGVLSDEAVLRPLKVAQGDRFMFWHLYDAPIDINLVNRSSSNVHLIPANEVILERIANTPNGAIVALSGELVDVHFPDNKVIPSSLSRLDTGPGACEILVVQDIRLLHPASTTIDTTRTLNSD